MITLHDRIDFTRLELIERLVEPGLIPLYEFRCVDPRDPNTVPNAIEIGTGLDACLYFDGTLYKSCWDYDMVDIIVDYTNGYSVVTDPVEARAIMALLEDALS